ALAHARAATAIGAPRDIRKTVRPQAGSRLSDANLRGDMAVTLSRRESRVPSWARRRRAALMEKFVIDGGVRLSGTMVPAGNKDGTLAILAECGRTAG